MNWTGSEMVYEGLAKEKIQKFVFLYGSSK